MSVGNNELFKCPGQILCALIDSDNNANKFSVIISRNSSGYYLTFISISGSVFIVSTSTSMKAKVFYIE